MFFLTKSDNLKVAWSCDICKNYKGHRLLTVIICIGVRSNIINTFSNFYVGSVYRLEQDVN